MITEHADVPHRQRLIRQKGIEIHGSFGSQHRMTIGRDGAVQIGQGLMVIEFIYFHKDSGKDIHNLMHLLEKLIEITLVVKYGFTLLLIVIEKA